MEILRTLKWRLQNLHQQQEFNKILAVNWIVNNIY